MNRKTLNAPELYCFSSCMKNYLRFFLVCCLYVYIRVLEEVTVNSDLGTTAASGLVHIWYHHVTIKTKPGASGGGSPGWGGDTHPWRFCCSCLLTFTNQQQKFPLSSAQIPSNVFKMSRGLQKHLKVDLIFNSLRLCFVDPPRAAALRMKMAAAHCGSCNYLTGLPVWGRGWHLVHVGVVVVVISARRRVWQSGGGWWDWKEEAVVDYGSVTIEDYLSRSDQHSESWLH